MRLSWVELKGCQHGTGPKGIFLCFSCGRIKENIMMFRQEKSLLPSLPLYVWVYPDYNFKTKNAYQVYKLLPKTWCQENIKLTWAKGEPSLWRRAVVQVVEVIVTRLPLSPHKGSHHWLCEGLVLHYPWAFIPQSQWERINGNGWNKNKQKADIICTCIKWWGWNLTEYWT